MLAWRTPEAAAGVAGELRGCCTGSAVPTGNNSIRAIHRTRTRRRPINLFANIHRRNVCFPLVARVLLTFALLYSPLLSLSLSLPLLLLLHARALRAFFFFSELRFSLVLDLSYSPIRASKDRASS